MSPKQLRKLGAPPGRAHTFRSATALAALLCIALSGCDRSSASDTARPPANVPALKQSGPTAFGFTPFPYDMTPEAVDATHRIIRDEATLYAIHLDEGIPWNEAFQDEPFPQNVRQQWDDLARRTPKDHAVYVGLAPLAKDRTSLAPAIEGSSLPKELRGNDLDTAAVKKAYLTYARRAVQQFHPDYLNLGIEAGELAHRQPKRWGQFVSLYQDTRAQLKREYPNLWIGISFGLHSLSDAAVAERAKPLVADSDYLGLSFYPYMSSFGEKYGLKPLPSGSAAWQDPLGWARKYTDKPIALCETGFTTQDIQVKQFDLKMRGDATAQAQYVRDLFDRAAADHYLFVVWFLPVDYDKFYDKLPKDETNLLWRNVGLYDGSMNPKPSLAVWREQIKKLPAVQRVVYQSPTNQTATPAGSKDIGFKAAGDLLAGTDRIALDPSGPEAGTSAMRWEYTYKKGEYRWCAGEWNAGRLAGASSMSVAVKSTVSGPIVLELEQDSGEGFYTTISAGTEWRDVSVKLSDFSRDTSKKSGDLRPERITKIMLADAAAVEQNAAGKRTVWLARLRFN